MALEADAVGLLRPEQMFVVSAVRLVADGASFTERRLVQVSLLELIRLIRVTR